MSDSLFHLLTNDGNHYTSWVYVKLFKLALSEGDVPSAQYLVTKRNVDPAAHNNEFVKLAVRTTNVALVDELCQDSRVDVFGALREAVITNQHDIFELMLFHRRLDMASALVGVYPDIPKEHRPKIIEEFANRLGYRNRIEALNFAARTNHSEMLTDLLNCPMMTVSEINLDNLKSLGNFEIARVVDEYRKKLKLKVLTSQALHVANEQYDGLSEMDTKAAFVAGFLAANNC